jgi:hypothetical protein
MKKKSERKKHFFKIVIVASGFALLDAETLFGRVLASKLIQGKMTDDSKVLSTITAALRAITCLSTYFATLVPYNRSL